MNELILIILILGLSIASFVYFIKSIKDSENFLRVFSSNLFISFIVSIFVAIVTTGVIALFNNQNGNVLIPIGNLLIFTTVGFVTYAIFYSFVASVRIHDLCIVVRELKTKADKSTNQFKDTRFNSIQETTRTLPEEFFRTSGKINSGTREIAIPSIKGPQQSEK